MTTTEPTKRCRRCRAELPLDAFDRVAHRHRVGSGPDAGQMRALCKDCRRAMRREKRERAR